MKYHELRNYIDNMKKTIVDNMTLNIAIKQHFDIPLSAKFKTHPVRLNFWHQHYRKCLLRRPRRGTVKCHWHLTLPKMPI